jgi:hypothetical protein
MSHGEYLNSQPLDISVVKNLQVDSIDNMDISVIKNLQVDSIGVIKNLQVDSIDIRTTVLSRTAR